MSVDGNIIACHECDQLQRETSLPPGGVAICCRCGASLYRDTRGTLDHTLALLLAAVIVFILANAFPIVSIEAQGNRNATTLFGAVQTLWKEGRAVIAGLVFYTTILAPALELLFSVVLLLLLRFRISIIALPVLLRLVIAAKPWSMVEVFMLGVLVAVVKLSHLAHIVPGIGLWAYAALIILLAWSTATYSARDLWARVPVSR